MWKKAEHSRQRTQPVLRGLTQRQEGEGDLKEGAGWSAGPLSKGVAPHRWMPSKCLENTCGPTKSLKSKISPNIPDPTRYSRPRCLGNHDPVPGQAWVSASCTSPHWMLTKILWIRDYRSRFRDGNRGQKRLSSPLGMPGRQALTGLRCKPRSFWNSTLCFWEYPNTVLQSPRRWFNSHLKWWLTSFPCGTRMWTQLGWLQSLGSQSLHRERPYCLPPRPPALLQAWLHSPSHDIWHPPATENLSSAPFNTGPLRCGVSSWDPSPPFSLCKLPAPDIQPHVTSRHLTQQWPPHPSTHRNSLLHLPGLRKCHLSSHSCNTQQIAIEPLLCVRHYCRSWAYYRQQNRQPHSSHGTYLRRHSK